MSELLLPSLGTVLLLLLVVDVFLTVFHPTARSGPVVRGLSRLIWGATRRVCRGGEATRDRLLSLAGPAIAFATPLTWMFLLILGFALIYFPFGDAFTVQPGVPGPAWLQAVYYSGYVALTLGLGDVVATGTALRLLTVVEAGAGFGVFSMAIAYVLSVYRLQSAQTALAHRIDHALRNASVDWSRPDRRVREWAAQVGLMLAGDLGEVNAAHRQFPILHYFRHPEPRDCLPVQVGRLLAWLGELEDAEGGARGDRDPPGRPALDGEREPDIESTDAPGESMGARGECAGEHGYFRSYSPFLALRRAVNDYVEELRAQFLPSGGTVIGVRRGGERAANGEEDRERDLRRVLAQLCYPHGSVREPAPDSDG